MVISSLRLSVFLNYYIDTADPNRINPDRINYVIKPLRNDIHTQAGQQITPVQLNAILRVILDYVPEEIREYKR